jgi:predicted ribosomally synthesized peptide with SipW-like signal peptide
MRARRKIAIATIAATVALGAAVSLAYFSDTRTTSQPISVSPYSYLPSDTSTVPAWSLIDASAGAPGTTITHPLAYADSLYVKPSNPGKTFATNRWFDVDFADYAPSGQVPESVTAEVDFSDDNKDKQKTCMYFEARRASTAAVLGTYGSSTTPLGCTAAATPLTVTQSLTSVVPNTDVANDLRLRLYFRDDGGNAMRIWRVVIKVVLLGKTWTLQATNYVDALDGSAGASQPWALAKVDTVAYSNTNNWPNAYNASRYLQMTFPSTVPAKARLTAAALETVWKTKNGTQQCFSFDTYSGKDTNGNPIKIGTHGGTTPALAAMCTTSATTWSTSTVPLSEMNTPAIANDFTVRLYGFAATGNITNLDRVALKLTWDLSTFDCVDAHTDTVDAQADTWADQATPDVASEDSGADQDVDLHVRSQSGSANRRAYLRFPLSTIPNGCRVTNAVLTMSQTTTQNGGTRTMDVYRAASDWSEPSLSWNNAPSPTGPAVGARNAVSSGQSVTWDVTSLVRSQYSTNDYGFVLRDHDEDASTASEQTFASRDGGVSPAPQLAVTFGEAP